MMSSPTRWSRMAPGKVGQAPASPSPAHPSCCPHATRGQHVLQAVPFHPNQSSKPHLGCPRGHRRHLTTQRQLHARLQVPQPRGQHTRRVHQVHQRLLAHLAGGGRAVRMRSPAISTPESDMSEALSSFMRSQWKGEHHSEMSPGCLRRGGRGQHPPSWLRRGNGTWILVSTALVTPGSPPTAVALPLGKGETWSEKAAPWLCWRLLPAPRHH